jgi:hypothetical protein
MAERSETTTAYGERSGRVDEWSPNGWRKPWGLFRRSSRRYAFHIPDKTPAGTSPDGWKPGKLEWKSPIGVIPTLLIVQAVEGSNIAKVIVANRGAFNEKKNVLEEGAIWRLIDAKVSGNGLEYAPRIDEERFIFNWRDANSAASLRSTITARLAGPVFSLLDLHTAGRLNGPHDFGHIVVGATASLALGRMRRRPVVSSDVSPYRIPTAVTGGSAFKSLRVSDTPSDS